MPLIYDLNDSKYYTEIHIYTLELIKLNVQKDIYIYIMLVPNIVHHQAD